MFRIFSVPGATGKKSRPRDARTKGCKRDEFNETWVGFQMGVVAEKGTIWKANQSTTGCFKCESWVSSGWETVSAKNS